MSNELTTAIQAHLQERVAHLTLRKSASAEEYAAPQVHVGALPHKERHDEPENFPHLVIRVTGGEIEGEGDQKSELVEVQIVCGIYTTEDVTAGEHDIVNLARWCVAALRLQTPLAKRFELKRLTWFKPDDQNPPHYKAQVESVWRIPITDEPMSAEMEIQTYGSGYF